MSLSIDGIASGLNTSELVEQLMQIERRPITLMKQRVQTYKQRLDAWRDVNMRLASLETKLGDLLLSSAYEARKATSSDQDVATAKASNTAVPATYKVEVLQVAQAQVLASHLRFDPDETLSGTMTVNGVTFDLEAESMTLPDLVEALNASDEAGVRASIIDGRLVLESRETNKSISWTGDIGLTEIQPPKAARVVVNGIELTRNSNELDDVVDGLTFTISGEGTTVIEVAKDVSGSIAKIKDVVDQLNSALDFIASRLEKDAILQGDSALMRLQSSLRMELMDRVETGNEINQLSAIGLRFSREGRMEIDEDKLREALENDSQAVYKLFAADEEHDGFSGVARRTRELIRSYTQTDGLIATRREMFESQIKDTEESIERMEERLARQEERLYSRFGAMEQALAALQTQSMWLQAQLMQLSAFNR